MSENVKRAEDIGSGELVAAATKRHIVAFLMTLPLPLAILIAPVGVLAVANVLGIGFYEAISDIFVILLVLPMVIIAVLVILYNYLNWRNDDFIVTNRRVIHVERFLFMAESRRDVPLTRIQDVSVISGFLDVLFDAADLQVTTAGAGVIDFKNCRRANEIKQLIFKERERAKAGAAALESAAVRQSIAEQLNRGDQSRANEITADGTDSAANHPPQTRTRNRVFDYFIPRSREVNETETGTMIVWRKHFLLLFARIFLPVMAILMSSYLYLSSLGWGLPPFSSPAHWLLQGLLLVAIAASLFWYVWEYDDWTKDVYIVTDTQIIDIEASSFRLSKTKRESTFDNIQGVYSEVPNLLHKLLNMGNVVIETAGTQDTFTFTGVYDPESVTSEIFNRLALYQQKQQDKSRESATNQMLTLLKEYHDLVGKSAY